MTTITLPRAVVEQALEALEYAQQGRECPSTTRQAITALRATLAQRAKAEPPKASAAGHGMAWPGLASSGLARFSQTGNGGQR